MSDGPKIENVMVTGATGFVGRSVVRGLLAKGLTPVCLVRSCEKLFSQHRDVDPDRFVTVVGSLNDRGALHEAAELSQATIHLVGIIMARRLQGQTFSGIHTKGTRDVVDAATRAGVERFVFMSAIGARPDAPCAYQKTKWEAEECVRHSGLSWTILRPSLIHGPHGEFTRLMKQMACSLVPPMLPYFGSGEAMVQPVSVKDVAHCTVESLSKDDAIGRIIPLGGPRAYSWVELYNAYKTLMPGARHWKPLVSIPGIGAKALAWISAVPLSVGELILPSVGKFRFDSGQVAMAQEDNVCDHTQAEELFDITMRSFEDELVGYAHQIP